MSEDMQKLLNDIKEIEALIERCRRESATDPEAAYAMALLKTCLEQRQKRLRAALH